MSDGLFLWSADGTLADELKNGGSRGVSFAFNHDESRLAALYFDGKLKIWDHNTRSLSQVLMAKPHTHGRLTYSSDGNDLFVQLRDSILVFSKNKLTN